MAGPEQVPDFLGDLVFQSATSPRSLQSTGRVYADVDPVTGGFATWVGDAKETVKVPIYNARTCPGLNLDANGFQLVQHHSLTVRHCFRAVS